MIHSLPLQQVAVCQALAEAVVVKLHVRELALVLGAVVEVAVEVCQEVVLEEEGVVYQVEVAVVLVAEPLLQAFH